MASERGQVVVILAMAFLVVLVGSSAVAVDVGNGLLQKQRLQNVADAATSAAASILVKGGDVSEAVDAAQNLVTASTGGKVSLPYPGTGTGANLRSGVEISGSDVRVALTRQVNTMFGGAVGLNTMAVTARARSSGTASTSFLPIAVKRFSAGNSAYNLAENGNPESVTDYLARADHSTIDSTLGGNWPSPLTSPAAVSPGHNPTYDATKTGPVTAILGQKAQPNVANGSDFHFWIAPDLRDITFEPPTYIDPPVSASTSAQQWKDIESSYFYPNKGYTGPLPEVGRQLATMNGVVTNMAVGALRKSFKIGEMVGVVVYNGTVYQKPDFTLTASPAVQSAGAEVVYTITVVPSQNFNSGGIQFSAVGLEGWGDWKFEDQSDVNTSYTKAIPAGVDTTLTFKVLPSGSPGNTKSPLIIAHDSATNKTRTAMVSTVGSDKGYSIVSAAPYQVVEQDSSTSFPLTLRGHNGYPATDVGIAGTVNWFSYSPGSSPPLGTPWTNPHVQVSIPGSGKVKVQSSKDANLTLNFDVDSSAAISGNWGQWIVQVPLTDGTAWLHLRVVPADSLTNLVNTTGFVNVLGYAYFVLSYHDGSLDPTHYSPSLDGGTVYGYAVSPLLERPDQSPQLGMRARLVPWD